MTTATVEAERLLKELEELWKGLACADSEAASGGVLRACSLTLIALADEKQPAGEVDETIARLMREHPSRAISIRLEGGAEGLRSRVFAQCWLPFGLRQQICCEEIEITAAASSLAELPAVLRGLTVPDLPVVVWSASPALVARPDIEAVLRLADVVIFDSERAEDGQALVAQQAASAARWGYRLADLAWTRLTRWREAIAQAFETGNRAACVREVVIEHSTSEPTLGARYLEAWLRVSLDRPLVISFRQVEGTPPRAIDNVRFSGDGVEARLERSPGGTLEVVVDRLRAQGLMPYYGDYDLLREELSIPGLDTIYENVLRRILA